MENDTQYGSLDKRANASSFISRKLRQAAISHDVHISNLNCIKILREGSGFNAESNVEGAERRLENCQQYPRFQFDQNDRYFELTAARRSYCFSIDGGGIASAAYLPEESAVLGINPKISEKVRPFHLFPIPTKEWNMMQMEDKNEESKRQKDLSTDENDEFMISLYQDNESESYYFTLKSVAALAYLCEEAAEYDKLANESLLPSILLFGPDLRSMSTAPNVPLKRKDGKFRGTFPSVVKTTDSSSNVNPRELNLVRCMGNYIYFLQGLYNFSVRCQRLARNMICQIAGCCSSWNYSTASDLSLSSTEDNEDANNLNYSAMDENIENHRSPNFNGVHLIPLAEALATVLRLLISIDTAISSNSTLLEAWELYKGVVREKSKKMQQENCMTNQMESFSRMIIQLDFSLMSSRSFLTAIEQNLDPGGMLNHYGTSLRENFRLHDEVKELISILYDRYISRLETDNEIVERRNMVGIYGLYALHRRLVPSNSIPDAKLHKQLMSGFPHLCPIVILIADLTFLPSDFMLQYAPFERKGWFDNHQADSTDSPIEMITFVRKFDIMFPVKAARLIERAIGWIVRADAMFAPSSGVTGSMNGRETSSNSASYAKKNNSVHEEADALQDPIFASGRRMVDAKTEILLQGVVIASRCSILARELVAIHKFINAPLISSLVRPLRHLCEVLKGMEKTIFGRRRAGVILCHHASLRSIASIVFAYFDRMRSFVDQQNSSDDIVNETILTPEETDKVNACMSVFESMLKGSSTYSSSRRFVAEIASCLFFGINKRGKMLNTDKFDDDSPFRQLAVLSDFDDYMRQYCDCSFLYFNQELFPVFIDDILSLSERSSTSSLQIILSAFSDPERYFLRCTPHLDSLGDGTNTYIQALRSYIKDDILQEKMVGPMCKEIETDLRISVHSMHLDSMNSFNPKTDKVNKWRQYLEMPPLRICGVRINLKLILKAYLETAFYNLATVSPHDSHAYSEMRFFADAKYGVQLADFQIPLCSLAQGFDVLNIVTDISTFVKKFNYDVSQQVFIEKKTERGAKYLYTISVSSIAASLKQHGEGIITITFNMAYKYLISKIQQFSHIFADDHICSSLSKERRWYKNNKQTIDNTYPFDRVVKYLKDNRKLGVTKDGHSFLDRLRILLTDIGNVLGLLRMVESARMRICSEAMQFISPSILKLETNLNEFFKQNGVSSTIHFSDDSYVAAKNMDKAMKAAKYDNNGKNYFSRLSEDFANVLGSSPDNFSNVFMLIPALSLCWMGASIKAKEMTFKKNRTRDAYYVDDGFAVGTAFVLEILKQNDEFDDLQWFQSLKQKFDDVKHMTQKESGDDEAGMNQRLDTTAEISFLDPSVSRARSEIDENDDMATLKVTAKRLEAHQEEMEMLLYSFHSTRVFFYKLI